VDDWVEQITRLAMSSAFQETASPKRALLDQIILARVHDAVEQRFGSGTTALASKHMYQMVTSR
jgi:hypothetical protein